MRKLIIAAVAALSLAALPAHADRGYYRGGHHSHRDGGSVWAGLAVVGVLAGLAIMADQSRPQYAAPAYVQPEYPPQPSYAVPPASPVPAPASPGTWYYCPSSAMYYPYTKACPEGWQAVPANPY